VRTAVRIVFVGGVACFPLAVVVVATGGGGPAVGLWFAAMAFGYLWLAMRLWAGSNAARTAIVILFAVNVAVEFLGSMGIALFVTLAVSATVIALLTGRAADQFFRPDAGDATPLGR
jgi:hypothetical protein